MGGSLSTVLALEVPLSHQHGVSLFFDQSHQIHLQVRLQGSWSHNYGVWQMPGWSQALFGFPLCLIMRGHITAGARWCFPRKNPLGNTSCDFQRIFPRETQKVFLKEKSEKHMTCFSDFSNGYFFCFFQDFSLRNMQETHIVFLVCFQRKYFTFFYPCF